MAPHLLFKQSSITPLPLPFHFTQFSSQNNMLHPTQNYSNYKFKAEKTFTVDDINDESGIGSPPLWKTSPQHEKNFDYRCLSPSSRTQAIARGQKELMEMVSKMPESCYELTLKDLVEHQPVAVVVETEQAESTSSIDEQRKSKKEKQTNNQKPQIKRSGSVDNKGFLLKMVFPVSLGSKKKKKTKKEKEKKKNDCNTSNTSKVSPKPTVTEDTPGNSTTVDKDWWKKRSESNESDGTGTTINTGSTKSSRSSSRSSGSYRSISSTSRRQRRKWKSCLGFILCRKNKASR